MDAVVHIGVPKTGSTTIQRHLRRNAAFLAERGILFHVGDWIRAENQVEVILAALQHGGLDLSEWDAARSASWVGDGEVRARRGRAALAALRRLRDTSPAQKVVFSSEHISMWLQAPAQVAALHDMLSACFDGVRYIAYVREPVAWGLSSYSERLKRGLSETLGAYANWCADDYARMLQMPCDLADRAGADAVDVRLFDRSAFAGDGLIQDFCAAAEVPIGDVREAAANEAFSRAEASLLRHLNAALPDAWDDARKGVFRKRAVEAMRRLQIASPSLAADPRFAEKMEGGTSGPVERLRETFFPDRARLFAAPATVAAHTDDARRDLETTLETVLALYISSAQEASSSGAPARSGLRHALDRLMARAKRVRRRALGAPR